MPKNWCLPNTGALTELHQKKYIKLLHFYFGCNTMYKFMKIKNCYTLPRKKKKKTIQTTCTCIHETTLYHLSKFWTNVFYKLQPHAHYLVNNFKQLFMGIRKLFAKISIIVTLLKSICLPKFENLILIFIWLFKSTVKFQNWRIFMQKFQSCPSILQCQYIKGEKGGGGNQKFKEKWPNNNQQLMHTIQDNVLDLRCRFQGVRNQCKQV